MFINFRKKKPRHQLALSILVGVSIVSFWRGVWGLMDLYFFPNSQTLSFITSIIIGLIILYSTKRLSDTIW